MSFIGTYYADLTGQQIGAFRVESLAGRDASGAPCWRIVCDRCQYPQTLPHSKIAPLVQGRNSQVSLLCANPACRHSHREQQSETIDEFRRRERREAAQEAKADAETKRLSDAQAEKDRKQSARDAVIQQQYLQYLNHQWAAGQMDEHICTKKRWFELTPSSRQIVLDLIQKDPTVRIGNL